MLFKFKIQTVDRNKISQIFKSFMSHLGKFSNFSYFVFNIAVDHQKTRIKEAQLAER